MAGDARVERRRTPRMPVNVDVECGVDLRVRVCLLDLSFSGALLEAPTTLPVGTRARLRTMLGGERFTPIVQVQRVAAAPSAGPPQVSVGALFAAMDERSRRSLEAFLQKVSA
jgi:hypothetical protein